MTTASEKAFTLQAVATVLQVPFELAREWLESGKIKGYRLGGEWWVSWSDFEAFLESPAYSTARRAKTN
jgi:excisionase family DNA binding protein